MSNETMTFTLTKRQVEQTFRCIASARQGLTAAYRENPAKVRRLSEQVGEDVDAVLAEVAAVGELFRARLLAQIEADGLEQPPGGRFVYPAPVVA